MRKILILAGLAGGSLCAQTADFRTTLYPILEKANCRACHNPEGVASATRLHFPEADAEAQKIEAFGNSLVILVDREHPDASLLLKKPTARIPHTGGERIKPNSPEEAVLKAWIAHLAQLSGSDLATALKYHRVCQFVRKMRRHLAPCWAKFQFVRSDPFRFGDAGAVSSRRHATDRPSAQHGAAERNSKLSREC